MSDVQAIDDPGQHRRLGGAAQKMTGALTTFIRDGAGPITGAQAYAQARRAQFVDPEIAIRRIVRESIAAAGTTGFVTGLGGFMTMPVTIPANLAGTAMINARMVAAIAECRGWETTDPAVQQLVLLLIVGESATAALHAVGVRMGSELTKQVIKKVPVEAVRALNRKVGFMLLAKYGTKRSVLTLVKVVPFVGGVVGGSVDAGFTRAIASAAKKAFPSVGP